MRPSGWFMSVTSAAVSTPIRLPSGRPASGASSGPGRSVFMNAPLPNFTSSTRASSPSASFLLMMLAVISGMLGTVAVTSRRAYSLLVGRDQVGRGAGDDAADAFDDVAAISSSDRFGAKAGDRFELVERAAGGAQAAAGDHRHRKPQQASSGARISEVLSPMPPVECLSTWEARPPRHRSGAAAEHLVGEARRFVGRHAAEVDRHRQGGHLVVGDFAPREALHERRDLLPGQLVTVALLGDDQAESWKAAATCLD